MGAMPAAGASSLPSRLLAKYVLNTMHWFFRLQENREDDLVEELKAALVECQAAVGAAAATEPGRERMGTTLTLAYILWPRAYVIHAGDSRCYLLRAGGLKRVTRDQTMAQKLVDEGTWTPEEAAESKWNHVLWSCINNNPDALNPDVHRFHMESGDVLLLCTDGLTRHVPDDGIAAQLARVPRSGRPTVRRLVPWNEAGGADNITVVAGHFAGVAPSNSTVETVGCECERKRASHDLGDRNPFVSRHFRLTFALSSYRPPHDSSAFGVVHRPAFGEGRGSRRPGTLRKDV